MHGFDEIGVEKAEVVSRRSRSVQEGVEMAKVLLWPRFGRISSTEIG